MKRSRKGLLVFLLGAGLLVAAIGIGHGQSADHIQFASRVATIDLAERELTFTGVSYVAVAAADCEIFRMERGLRTPILFSDIQVGDSTKVCGVLQADNDVLANKIRVFSCK